MRSSKSRSRSKQNRPRTLGNIINRVFDSSGPEGKVRGTPQQIIEKYQLLARDAQLSNDRVAAENFLQHAEHYTRLLAEATREQLAEQEARQQYHQQNQGGNGQGNGGNGPSNGNGNGQSNGNGNNRDRQNGERDYRNDRDQRSEDFTDEQPYVSSATGFDVVGEDDSGLVELPEFARPQRRDGNQDRTQERQQDRQPDRARDDRPRSDRNDRPKSDNAPRPKPQQDRPQQDRRPDTRNEQRGEPRIDQRPEPRNEPRSEPRFVEQPAAPVFVAPEPVVQAEAPAPKAAPKPRTRKPVVKTEAKVDAPTSE